MADCKNEYVMCVAYVPGQIVSRGLKKIYTHTVDI